MSKTKAAETLRNGEQKGRWVCARLTDLVSLVLAKLCGFFSQLCTCVTHSRLFISVGMVEPQGKPKYFIERLVVGFGWVWYWLVVVWFFFHLPLVHRVQPQKSSLCAPEVRVRAQAVTCQSPTQPWGLLGGLFLISSPFPCLLGERSCLRAGWPWHSWHHLGSPSLPQVSSPQPHTPFSSAAATAGALAPSGVGSGWMKR